MPQESIDILYLADGTVAPRLVFDSELARVPFRVVPTSWSAWEACLGEELSAGRPPQAVICDLDSCALDSPVDEVARLSRRVSVPLLTVGAATPEQILELATLGVSGYLPAAPDPGTVAAKLLVVLDRQRTEQELRRGYLAFREVFERLDVPVAIIDKDYRILKSNHALHQFLGHDAEELAGLTVADITHPGDAGSLELLAELTSGRRDHYLVRKRYLRADGSVVWGEASVSAFQDPVTGELRCIAEIRDVTPEVRVQEERDLAHSSFLGLFENNPVPTLLLDSEHRLLATNPAAVELLGHGPSDLHDLGFDQLFADPAQGAEQRLRLGSAHTVSRPATVRLRHREGRVLRVEMTAARIGTEAREQRLLLLRPQDSSGGTGAPARPLREGSDEATVPAYRILLVDDDDAVRFLVREMLRDHGYRVDAVSSGEEALRKLETEDFALVITDASMPGISGPDLLRRLEAAQAEVRVLVISGYGENLFSSRREGEVPFLAKPFTAEELVETVEDLLQPAVS